MNKTNSKTSKPKTNLITNSGYDRLYSELRLLADIERPKLLEEIAAAAAQGDRSENAEYIYGRKRLREVDKRINFIRGRLEIAKILNPPPTPIHKVEFACRVTISDENGLKKTWYIVGEDEADPSSGQISWKSPLGRSLLNKVPGDFAIVETPNGDREFEIITIASV